MTRAARPQTGRIRHQNDCLVKTSNFSSLSAWGLELRSGSAPRPPPPDFPASRCWVSGLWGQPRRKGPEAGTPDAPLRCTIAPGKPWGETDRALSWGAPDRLVAKKSSPATISAGALVFLVTMTTQESPRTLATMGRPQDRRAFPESSEACKALLLPVALGFPECPAWVQRGRD